ncbi:hypothetical protein [Psychromonas arctica]|uniref:hypothetical protein n=1 Tax=Psychromonas arctica TaxID=168275 RepID=UPI002FD3CC75
MSSSVNVMGVIANVIMIGVFLNSWSKRSSRSLEENSDIEPDEPKAPVIKHECIKAYNEANAAETSALEQKYSLTVVEPLFIIDVIGDIKVTDILLIESVKVEYPLDMNLTVEMVGEKVRLAVIDEKFYLLSCDSFSIV